MLRKPKYASDIVSKWTEYYESRKSEGTISERAIFRHLSEESGVSPYTIANYFHRERNRVGSLKSWSKRTERIRKKRAY